MRRLKFPVRLFHLSIRPLTDLFVRPRIPRRDDVMEGEETRTPRFCMAETLGGCVRALGYSDPGCVGTRFFIYEPEDASALFAAGGVFRPNRFEVPDSSLTGEVWITKPFRLKETGQAVITGFWNGAGNPANRYSIKGTDMYVDDFEIAVRGESGPETKLEGMNAKNIEKTEKRGIKILTVVAPENEKPTVFARAVEKDGLESAVAEAASSLVPSPADRLVGKIVDRLLAGKPAWYLDEYCFEWYEV